jgi:hypothetical protein
VIGTLEQMRQNPAGGWRIGDVVKVCTDAGATCSPPRGGGSHYKVSKIGKREILTIPSRRPIKPIYIRKLIAFLQD